MELNKEPTVRVTVTPEELTIAEKNGLVIPKPDKSGIIVWGPSQLHDSIPSETDGITLCSITKYTIDDFRETRSINYADADDDYYIVIEANDNVNRPDSDQ